MKLKHFKNTLGLRCAEGGRERQAGSRSKKNWIDSERAELWRRRSRASLSLYLSAFSIQLLYFNLTRARADIDGPGLYQH
jgi:hypothetical protein